MPSDQATDLRLSTVQGMHPKLIDGAAGLQRFAVIFGDDSLLETIFADEHETQCLFFSTANVLANDYEEAMVLASQADFEGHHLPVAALTASDLRKMADALDRCPFTENRRVTYTTGGYANAEQLERVAARDDSESPILKV